MGTHIRIQGGFEDALEGEARTSAQEQTAAVESLYDDIGYTVEEIHVGDDVEPPTCGKYHGRTEGTVRISLSSLEQDLVEGTWAHELGHDVGRQTFYDAIRDEPRLYRSLVDETFAYLVQYEVTGDVPDRSAVAERYFGDDRPAWTSLLNSIDPDTLEGHGDRLAELEEAVDEVDTLIAAEEIHAQVEELPSGVADNMLVDDLPLQEYLDGCERIGAAVDLLDDVVEDGELDDTVLGARLYSIAGDPDAVLRKPVQQELYAAAYERSEDGFGGFLPAGEQERLMSQHARSSGLEVIEDVVEDELEAARAALEQQWAVAGADDTAAVVAEAIEDEKYGYGAGHREGYTRYLDFPHGAGRLLAATLYEEGVRSHDVIERPEAVLGAAEGVVHDIIDGAVEGRDVGDHGAQYARGNLRLERVIRG